MLKDYLDIEKSSKLVFCDECSKGIKAGNQRVRMIGSSFRGLSVLYKYYHPACYYSALLKLLKKPKGKFLTGFEMARKLLIED